MITQLHPVDKRRERRLPAANFCAQIKVKQGLFSSWIDMNVLDFNLLGMSLALPSEPELGSKLSLRLVLNVDMGKFKVNQIEAKIVNKVMMDRENSTWRVGLVFSTQSKQSGDTLNQMGRIKEMLERNEAISQRLQA